MSPQTRLQDIQRKVVDVGVLGLLIGILVSVGVLSVIGGMKLAVRSSEVEVPRIEGLTLKEASRILDTVQLSLDHAGDRYASDVPEGSIVYQFPRGGSKTKKGRRVKALFSKGPRTHPVPDLVGSSSGVAEVATQQTNYVIGHVSTMTLGAANEDRKGKVLAQSPFPGSNSAVTPRIDILVESGEAISYVMPEFLGKSLSEVKPFLNGKKMKLDRVHYRLQHGTPKGTVIGQFPRPGHLVKSDQGIRLVVVQ
jgi:beta-lactam-binding protein with PASTA domain